MHLRPAEACECLGHPFKCYGHPDTCACANARKSRDAMVADIIRDVAELPDRESPLDWPEAMLVTADELRDIILSHLNP